MSDVAGRNAWLANMAAQGARGRSSGEPAQTADNHGMAAIANFQTLPAPASASPAAISAVDEPSKSPEPRGVGLSHRPIDVEANGGRGRGGGATPRPRTIHRK